MARRQKFPVFVQVFKQATEALLWEQRVSALQFQVWMFLALRCEWGNWVETSHQEISACFRVHRSTVSRIMQVLVEAGMVLREPSGGGRQWRYRLPATLVHHGRLEEVAWRQARDRTSLRRGSQEPGGESGATASVSSGTVTTDSTRRRRLPHG